MVQTSEQYEFVHHALCLYESRLSAETVQWFTEDHQSLGMINQITHLRLLEGASCNGKEELWSQPVAWTAEDLATYSRWPGSCVYECICKHPPNYFEGPMLMEVWYISHTAQGGFCLSVLTTCHTKCLCVIFSDNCRQVTTGSAAEEIIIVFRCFIVCKVCLVNGLSPVQLFRFKCYYLCQLPESCC
jgi:hypothetical protein